MAKKWFLSPPQAEKIGILGVPSTLIPPPWGGGGVCQNLEIKGILSKNLEIKQNFVDMMLKLRFVVDMEARDVPHKAQE